MTVNKDKIIKINLTDSYLVSFIETINKSLKLEPVDAAFLFREKIEILQTQKNKDNEKNLRFSIICSLLSDLLEQGWVIKSFDQLNQFLYMDAPSLDIADGEDLEEVKHRIRSGLTAISNKQLASKSVQEFLQKMETPKKRNDQLISILDLVDHGNELVESLEGVQEADLEEALNNMIQPFVEVCEDKKVCEKTGLKLLDVWRYFRHTWSLEYKPLPGRTMRLLIRNKARPNWPIMGIAMLASPAMNLYVRDEWIQWRLDDIYSGLMNKELEAKSIAQTLFKTIQNALDDINKNGLLTQRQLETPSEDTLFRLKQIAEASHNNRRAELSILENKKQPKEEVFLDIRHVKDKKNIDWKKLSETSLYRKKRAETLVPLLKSYWYFKGADIETEPEVALYSLLSDKRGQEAVSVALNELRKAKLASQVADVSVCGAIAPYNELLGGKLVAILMGSKEVRDIYKNKYEGQISEISSQLAGKPITRSADLLAITTTSLYGVGSSQYNRIKIPANYVEGMPNKFEWKKLKLTTGFGVTHISDETVKLMKKLSHKYHGSRRVNSVFGEGSSPKVRLIRDALIILGIDDSVIMKHGMSRIVYACEYYPNARGDLSGFNPSKASNEIPSVSTLSKAWIKRWVVNRLKREETVVKLKKLNKDSVAKKLNDRVNHYNELHNRKVI